MQMNFYLSFMSGTLNMPKTVLHYPAEVFFFNFYWQSLVAAHFQFAFLKEYHTMYSYL